MLPSSSFPPLQNELECIPTPQYERKLAKLLRGLGAFSPKPSLPGPFFLGKRLMTDVVLSLVTGLCEFYALMVHFSRFYASRMCPLFPGFPIYWHLGYL